MKPIAHLHMLAALFIPGGRAFDTHGVGVCVGSRASLDALEKKKKLS
jgi:hypothetical protein